MHQPCGRVNPDVQLHPEVVLIPLLHLPHLRVRCPVRFLVDDGASMMLTSTIVPSLIRSPWTARCSLISANSPCSSSCFSSRWRKCSIVLSSGRESVSRSPRTAALTRPHGASLPSQSRLGCSRVGPHGPAALRARGRGGVPWPPLDNGDGCAPPATARGQAQYAPVLAWSKFQLLPTEVAPEI